MGIALAGCSSMPDWTPSFLSSKPSAEMQPLRFESDPPGADVRTTGGQTCLTPCAIPVPAEPQSVTITIDRLRTADRAGQRRRRAGSFISGSRARSQPGPQSGAGRAATGCTAQGRPQAAEAAPDRCPRTPAAAAPGPARFGAPAAWPARTLGLPPPQQGGVPAFPPPPATQR